MKKWVQQTTATSPPGATLSGFCWDGTNSEIVMLIGNKNGVGAASETWTYDGTTWTHLTPATAPTTRYAMSMCWDQANANVVMRGGLTAAATFRDDTWTWNGTTWTDVSPGTQPAAKEAYALCYDEANSNVVLFGGVGVGGRKSETWIWNGTTWTNAAPAHNPSARNLSAIFYDKVRGSVILFGGLEAGGVWKNDTWEWDGTDWTQLSPTTTPHSTEGLGNAGYAWDDTLNVGIVYAGSTSDTSLVSAEMWLWDGTDWSQQLLCADTGALTAPGMAYDPAVGKTVLFGGTLDGDQEHGETTTWRFPYGCPRRQQLIRWH